MTGASVAGVLPEDRISSADEDEAFAEGHYANRVVQLVRLIVDR